MFLKGILNRKPTQINLVGGLGNQLFGYIAGKYLEKFFGHNVVFNTWHIPKGLTDHGVTVEARNLEGEFRRIAPPSNWEKKLQTNFRSANPGWNHALGLVPKGSSVDGYFQTWKYANALGGTVLSRDQLILSNGPSGWLKRNIDIARSVKPIMLHFRRGDYKKVSQFMGLLERDYYLKALAEIKKRFENPPIWVFSDEPELADRFFRNLDGNFKIVCPPRDVDPGDSLILMTYGQAHIISNSTFAWWGAYLSPETQIVAAPTPWLRAPDDPEDLFPNNWLLIEHTWGNL